jgi:hypothetical protein
MPTESEWLYEQNKKLLLELIIERLMATRPEPFHTSEQYDMGWWSCFESMSAIIADVTAPENL